MKVLVSVIAIFLALMLVFPAYGQDNSTMGRGTVTNTQTIEGKVTRIDGEMLTIDTNEGIKQLMLPGNVGISRNGAGIAANEIQLNDRITIESDSMGNVLQADVTSGGIFDSMRWVIPTIGAVLVGLVAFSLVRSRANKQYFKTSISTAHDIRRKENK